MVVGGGGDSVEGHGGWQGVTFHIRLKCRI